MKVEVEMVKEEEEMKVEMELMEEEEEMKSGKAELVVMDGTGIDWSTMCLAEGQVVLIAVGEGSCCCGGGGDPKSTAAPVAVAVVVAVVVVVSCIDGAHPCSPA